MVRCGCSSPGVIGCGCDLIDSNCINVSGDGEPATPYTLAPFVSGAANQIVSCGSAGLKATVSDAAYSAGLTKASASITSGGSGTVISWDGYYYFGTKALTWSGGTPTRLTVPTGAQGIYLFMAFCNAPIANPSLLRLQLRKNGTDFIAERGVPGLGGSPMVVSTIVNMVATNYIETIVFQDVGTTQTVGPLLMVGARITRG